MRGPKSYLGWTVDYATPPGEPAFIGPDAVSWRVFKNPVALAIGGVCAVLLEFADARIRTGVWEHSDFRTDPARRAQRTATAAMIGVYGPESAARRMIQGITNMHAGVKGTTPEGVSYSALDSELLDWVAATASFGFVTAYDRFIAPLPAADQDRFYREGEVVARLYGVQDPVLSRADFDAMLTRRLPDFEPHPIIAEFLAVMSSGRAAPGVPKGLQSVLVHAAVELLPPPVRDRLELGPQYGLSTKGRLTVESMGRIAEYVPDLTGPAAQACRRLGLPRRFLWMSARGQQHALLKAQAGSKQADTAPERPLR